MLTIIGAIGPTKTCHIMFWPSSSLLPSCYLVQSKLHSRLQFFYNITKHHPLSSYIRHWICNFVIIKYQPPLGFVLHHLWSYGSISTLQTTHINFHDKVFLRFLPNFCKKWRKTLSWKFMDESSVKYLRIGRWGRWIQPRCGILYIASSVRKDIYIEIFTLWT